MTIVVGSPMPGVRDPTGGTDDQEIQVDGSSATDSSFAQPVVVAGPPTATSKDFTADIDIVRLSVCTHCAVLRFSLPRMRST
jgi:hypothetical protein